MYVHKYTYVSAHVCTFMIFLLKLKGAKERHNKSGAQTCIFLYNPDQECVFVKSLVSAYACASSSVDV